MKKCQVVTWKKRKITWFLKNFHSKHILPYLEVRGKVASCVGWAAGYGALSIERSIALGITDRKHITDSLAHSAMYLYQNIKRGDGCLARASINDALTFLNRRGDCLKTTYPTSSISCSLDGHLDADEEALQFKIPTAGFKVFDKEENLSDKIRAVKAHLSAGHPVIVGMSETPPYRSLVNQAHWQVEPRKQGGHAMVAVGYSDDKQCLELLNSYGASWGKQGFIEISYRDFAQYCQQAFVLSNELGRKNKSNPKVEHLVDLKVRVQINVGNNPKNFYTPLGFSRTSHVYKPDSMITRNDQVQCKIHMETGRCAYLINMDEQGKARLIWSMEYPSKDTLLSIPQEGWWEFSSEGEELFCLLYGYEAINDTEAFVSAIRHRSNIDLYQAITSSNRLQICTPEKISFGEKEILAQAKLRSRYEKFIPIFFHLNIGL